ncbi:MAG: hypothetical protein U0441_11500 [Polyangiaceae bacterium]
MIRASLATGALLSALAVSSTGCLDNDVQLGGTGGTGGAAAGDVWTGYIENYKFPSGSDHLTVRITGVVDGVATGTVRLGDAPDLPPPTDPDVAYPPDYSATHHGEIGPKDGAPYEGFDYTLQDGVYTATRLKGHMFGTEVWNAWCALQTPYELPSSPGMYKCTPNGPETWDFDNNVCTDNGIQFDCGKQQLCSGITCECDADHCHGSMTDQKLVFDLKIEGGQAHGSVEGLLGGTTTNVWLTRASGD